MAASCPGYASWETLPNFQTRVTYQGQTYIPVFTGATASEKTFIARLQEAWAKYGDMITRATEGTGFPIPWFMGILCAESLGNINACAPCGKENGCGLTNCTQCCAFGIMQIIDSTARAYGGVTGASLLGNPELSFKVAAKLFVSIVSRYGMNLPMIAGAYNSGGFTCRQFSSPNMFGNIENNGYTQRVVTFANTAVALGIGTGASGTASARTAPATIVGGLLVAGSALALMWHWRR